MGIKCCCNDKDEPEIIANLPEKNIITRNRHLDNNQSNNLIIVNPIQNNLPFESYNTSNEIYLSNEQIVSTNLNENVDLNNYVTKNSNASQSPILNEKQIQAMFDQANQNLSIKENPINKPNYGQNIIYDNPINQNPITINNNICHKIKSKQ